MLRKIRQISAAIAATAAAALTLSSTALAERYSYGAIALSPTTNAIGYAYNAASEEAAGNDAISRCSRYAEDCQIAVNFWNGCGALAIGRHGWGAAWSANKEAAEAKALEYCSAHTHHCTVQRWVCSEP